MNKKVDLFEPVDDKSKSESFENSSEMNSLEMVEAGTKTPPRVKTDRLSLPLNIEKQTSERKIELAYRNKFETQKHNMNLVKQSLSPIKKFKEFKKVENKELLTKLEGFDSFKKDVTPRNGE